MGIPVMARLVRDELVIIGILAAAGVWGPLTFTGKAPPSTSQPDAT